MSKGVRIPNPTSLEKAVSLYYTKLALRSEDIQDLFGEMSKTRIQKLKSLARNKMHEANVKVFDSTSVSTKEAYEAWGLSIEDIEHRIKSLKRILN